MNGKGKNMLRQGQHLRANPARQIEAFAEKGVMLDKVLRISQRAQPQAPGLGRMRPIFKRRRHFIYIQHRPPGQITTIFFKDGDRVECERDRPGVIKHALEFLSKQKTSSLDKLSMHLLTAFAEHENDIIRERHREGI